MRDYDALLRYVADREAMPFTWGPNDCCSFVAGAIEAQTGANPVRRAGLTWTTQRGARRVLKRLGGQQGAVDGILRPIALAMAQRGDAGMIEGEGVPMLVLIEGVLLAAPGDAGLVRYPRALLVRAWSADG
jgi:hypothetical protein